MWELQKVKEPPTVGTQPETGGYFRLGRLVVKSISRVKSFYLGNGPSVLPSLPADSNTLKDDKSKLTIKTITNQL